MTTPLFIALCGPHAVGKSTQTDALAKALCARGIPALGWHHTGSRGGHVMRALWFAWQRAELIDDLAAGIVTVSTAGGVEAPRVVVCDRWSMDTLVLSHALPLRRDSEPGGVDGWALLDIVNAEDRTLPRARYVLLDCDDTVLAARTVARDGRAPTDLERAERREVREQARLRSWPRVDTRGAPEDVTAELVSIALGFVPTEVRS